jgi:hypothetical protein
MHLKEKVEMLSVCFLRSIPPLTGIFTAAALCFGRNWTRVLLSEMGSDIRIENSVFCSASNYARLELKFTDGFRNLSRLGHNLLSKGTMRSFYFKFI